MNFKAVFIILLLIFLAFLFFKNPTCNLPEEYKNNSAEIGLLSDSQGMITYDVYLRADGKYICNNAYANDYYTYGVFTYTKDSISLFPVCDNQNLLCTKYYIDNTSDIGGYTLAIPQCNSLCENSNHEELWFKWLN